MQDVSLVRNSFLLINRMQESLDESSSDQAHSDSQGDRAYLENYLSFLKLTKSDSERLQAFLPLFRNSSEEFVDAFYDHLLSFEETAKFLQDSKVVKHLKQSQQVHWESVLESNWDSDFVERRRTVGQTHAKRGVEVLFFLGANYQFIEHLVRNVAKQDSGTTKIDGQMESFLSVVKAVFLEVGLTLESYFAQLSEDLQRALNMVWKANEQLEQFAKLTSHDLKTPLGTVSNLCEEALDEFQDEMPKEAVHLIDNARQTALRMSGLIDELLSVSMATHRKDIQDEVCSKEIISEVLDRLKPDLDQKNITVTISGELPFVAANKIQLREAFYNLIHNAAKYIDNDAGQIEVSAKNSGEDYLFSIIDNGPGIPPEEIAQIFTAFHRLEMHQDSEGTGLGLYFAKSLIEHQGGKIWVESELGKGSCFHVLLKRC